MKLGIMEIKTLYRAEKVGWYECWCPATCKKMKSRGLVTVNQRGKILLTDTGQTALAGAKDTLEEWGWR